MSTFNLFVHLKHSNERHLFWFSLLKCALFYEISFYCDSRKNSAVTEPPALFYRNNQTLVCFFYLFLIFFINVMFDLVFICQ